MRAQPACTTKCNKQHTRDEKMSARSPKSRLTFLSVPRTNKHTAHALPARFALHVLLSLCVQRQQWNASLHSAKGAIRTRSRGQNDGQGCSASSLVSRSDGARRAGGRGSEVAANVRRTRSHTHLSSWFLRLPHPPTPPHSARSVFYTGVRHQGLHQREENIFGHTHWPHIGAITASHSKAPQLLIPRIQHVFTPRVRHGAATCMLNSHTTRQHELAPPWAPAGLAAADQLPDADAAARAADGIDAAAAQQQQQPCKGCAAADTSSAKMIMPPHGVKALANGRNMEDTFAAEALLAPSSALLPPHLAKKWPELALFGVFDGHGGVEVAAHAAARLPQHLGAALARQLLPLRSTAGTNPPRRQQPGGSGGGADRMMVTVSGGSCCSGESPRSSDGSSGSDGSGGSSGAGGSSAADSVACYSSARGGGGGGDNEDDDADGSPTSQAAAAAHGGGSGGGGGGNSTLGGAAAAVCEALRRAFAATDAELGGTEVGELVGSTAVVAAVGAAELFVAHAGDSRAVLCRKGVAVPLTLDHKPTRPDELARVTAAGGRVTTRGGTARVMGLLAMSRALGDQLLRGAGVVCDPEVAALPRGRDDELLLLATDGLWDVVGPQEAVNLALRSTMRARERGAGAAAACRVGASVLARAAVERGSRDNVTVLVVDLRRHAEGGASPGSVGAMLATTCSELLPHHHAPSRKRRSSSGSDAAAMGGGADAMAGAGAGAAAAACATPGCGCGGGAAGHRPAAVGGAAAAAIGHLPSLEERPERSPSPLPPPLKQQHQQAALPRHIQALESSLAAVAAAITGPRRGARRSSTGGSGGGSGGGVFNSLLTATTPAWPPAAATNAAAAAADATASVAAAYPRPLRLPATLSAPPPSARGGGAAPVVTTEPPSPAAAPESPPPACLLAPPPQSAAGAGASGTGVAGLRLWGGARTTSFTCVETGRVGFGLNCDEPQQPQPQLQPQPPATPMQPPLQPQQLAGLPPPAPAATAAGAGVGGGRPPRPPSHPGGGGF